MMGTKRRTSWRDALLLWTSELRGVSSRRMRVVCAPHSTSESLELVPLAAAHTPLGDGFEKHGGRRAASRCCMPPLHLELPWRRPLPRVQGSLLPDDVWALIARELRPAELRKLAAVCKMLNQETNSKLYLERF